VLLQNLLVWTIAVGLVIYLARGLTIHQMVQTLARCDLTLFVAANFGSLILRWLADTYLFARLFSFFHGRTSSREVLPASTAQYFLQALNILVADAALVVFLHQRKGVEWITAGWTIAFQGFVDAILMSALTVIVGLLIPWSPIRIALPYASVALAFFVLVALWWMSGSATGRPSRWLRGRREMLAFRSARLHHYAVLGLVRFLIYVPSIIGFYLYFVAFHLRVPFAAVLALSPALIFAQSAPFSPSGLGPLQAVMVDGFARFAPRNELLTVALGVSIAQLLCRIPLGVGTAGTFARMVLTAESPSAISARLPGVREESRGIR
jgi:uncharacterized membrane protein YbhN (UPF0104 family)